MSRREAQMWNRLIELDSSSGQSLQAQLREALVRAILDGHIAVDEPLPSSRELARQLQVARNTVVLAYQHLIDEHYLVSRERKGYFVNAEILSGRVQVDRSAGSNDVSEQPDWSQWIDPQLENQRNITRPLNWRDYEYPFVYGQIDSQLFPVNDWRESCRLSLHVGAISEWTHDRVDHDDELLLEQIHTRVLPRRGVWASKEEILVTTGAQNALYLLAQLLARPGSCVGIEDPCYADARNIFSLFTSNFELFPVGDDGVTVDDRVRHCDLLYVTPSHQCPTTTTLPLAKRKELLQRSREDDFLIIEDDYESELNFVGEPTPALKSLDQGNRVIYVGSLSKTVAPGLRVGFMVASPEVIRQARALRRLMYRHPPTNNQRTVGHFLALGHHDSVLLKLSQTYRQRWEVMEKALSQHMSMSSKAPAFGGSSFWVQLPPGMCADELEARAAEESILINAGGSYFADPPQPCNYLRLGFGSINEEKIEAGIFKLAQLITRMDHAG